MRATTVLETGDLISGAPRVGFDSLALAGKGAASNEKSAESPTRTRQRPFRLRVWWAMRIEFSTAFRQLFPTLPTLLRIAMVFGVGLEHFFIKSAERPTLAIVRKKDRVRLPERPNDDSPSYFFESLDFPVADRRMEAFYAEFEPRSESPVPHSHPGAEVIFVISGQLALNVDGEDALLGEGDSIYFDSGFSHSYRRHGRASCSAIVVISPDKR